MRREPPRRFAVTAPTGLLALMLAACGARPAGPALETAPPAPGSADVAGTPAGTSPDTPAGDLAPTGLPGMGPYSLLILAGPTVDELELVGMAYAASALGWRVTITAPATAALRGRHGLGLPLDTPLASVDAARFDALFVPKGAPADPASLALVERFAAPTARPLLLATNGGLDAVRAAPSLVGAPPAARDEGVHFDGHRLVAARPGDLPALAHALEAIARDRWPTPAR